LESKPYLQQEESLQEETGEKVPHLVSSFVQALFVPT